MANVKRLQKTSSVHNLPHVVTEVNKKVELAQNQLTDLIQEFPKSSIKRVSNAIRHCFDKKKLPPRYEHI